MFDSIVMSWYQLIFPLFMSICHQFDYINSSQLIIKDYMIYIIYYIAYCIQKKVFYHCFIAFYHFICILINLMQSQPIDSIMQHPIIGVYPININNIHEAKDGGACKFSKEFIKTYYLDGNGNNSGYYVPGGYFLSFSAFHGGHQLWLDNFELKKGMAYTLSCWLRINSNKNPWNNGVGKISSQKAMFMMKCSSFVSGMLEVGKNGMKVQINDCTPQLKKYVSQPYIPQNDELVSVIIHPWLYNRNGFLWDFCYPQIQWRSIKAPNSAER